MTASRPEAQKGSAQALPAPSDFTFEGTQQGSQTIEPLSRAARGIGRRDPLEAHGLVRIFIKPAAFIGANWAAILGSLTVIGIVPALSAATRVTADLAQYEDSAFTSALRHLRRTLSRDAPASLLLLLVVGGIGGNALILPVLESSFRVLVVGFLLPILWALVAVLSAYVVAAARDGDSDRSTIVLDALSLVRHRPLAALAAPPLIILLSPLWLLAPLTIACGLSVPPWIVGRLWGPA